MSTPGLIAVYEQREMGQVFRDPGGKLRFLYASSWRDSVNAFPLSHALPLAASEHRGSTVESFLWGLLPDQEQVLQRWARDFQASPRNAFALLSVVGEDCAGAIRFLSEERWKKEGEQFESGITWLSEADIEDRLRLLRQDHATGRMKSDRGQFSLAGAQPKTAFYFVEGKWGIPGGRIPTTHILKPPTGEFEGHAENEHYCLRLARAIGLPTANSSVQRFGAEVAIVVERYDRQLRSDGNITRLHQEDLCQALGVHPAHKYENQGGPGALAIYQLLHTASSKPMEDTTTFLDALIFQWFIAGTDAHAKNYSILHGLGQKLRLAPLYDLASVLPYDRIDFGRADLAMKIGGKKRLNEIGPRQWQKLAANLNTDPRRIVERVIEVGDRLREAIPLELHACVEAGLTHPLLSRLADRLEARANERCAVMRTALDYSGS